MDLIAQGRDADVFAVDQHRVLRRYRAGGDTAREAEVMRYVGSHGYPVPTVHAASGSDLVLERVAGPTLLAALASGSVGVHEASQLLADLHTRLHSIPPRAAAGHPVVHLDLHPDNVLLAPRGAVVIDWRNATDGSPAVDLAVTAVIAALVALDGEHPLAPAAREMLPAFIYASDVGLVQGLPGAVALRRADPKLTAAEKRRLSEAEALIRALAG
jgi:aminoglycoside phosphotransferase (APT) family kinase protein